MPGVIYLVMNQTIRVELKRICNKIFFKNIFNNNIVVSTTIRQKSVHQLDSSIL